MVAFLLGLLAMVLNIVALLSMVRIERKLLREGKLPQRGILHLKDYNFFMVGDIVWVSVMDFAILYVLTDGWPLSVMAITVCVLAALVWTGLWHFIWLQPSHRPDVLYPRAGEVSLLGQIHLVYFFVQYALGFLGLWIMMYMVLGFRPWSWAAALGLLAAGVYFLILWSEFARGKFRRPFVPRG